MGTGAVAAGLTITDATSTRSTEAAMTGGTISITDRRGELVADATNVAFAHAPGVSVGLAALS